jgi:hypothetical protein
MTDDTDTGTRSCQSCSMTIESGTYCQYCTDDDGGLLAFEETFERFVQFALARDDSLDRPTAEANTRAFMATMPAWRDHPAVAQAGEA